MIDTGLSRLYSPELLALATELYKFPLTDDLPQRASGRSRTCGSTIDIGLATDAGGRIERIGMRISACAVGQASCALLAREAVGVSSQEISETRDGLVDWLDGKRELPGWPGLAALAPARGLTGRHGAILLPWNAAVEALSNAPASS